MDSVRWLLGDEARWILVSGGAHPYLHVDHQDDTMFQAVHRAVSRAFRRYGGTSFYVEIQPDHLHQLLMELGPRTVWCPSDGRPGYSVHTAVGPVRVNVAEEWRE